MKAHSTSMSNIIYALMISFKKFGYKVNATLGVGHYIWISVSFRQTEWGDLKETIFLQPRQLNFRNLTEMCLYSVVIHKNPYASLIEGK